MILFNKTNHLGFASLTILVMISLIFAITFSFCFVANVQLIKSDIRNLCLTESVSIQKLIIRSEKKLLSHNTQSTYLSEQLIQAYSELATATATENGAAAVIALNKIQYFEAEQVKLDAIQKQIILETRQKIIFQSNQLLNLIESRLNKIVYNWSAYLFTKKYVRIVQLPLMAVHPESYTLAPNYLIDLDHYKTQRLAFNWQYEIQTNNDQQKLINSNNKFSFICGASFLKTGEKWKIEINEDKF